VKDVLLPFITDLISSGTVYASICVLFNLTTDPTILLYTITSIGDRIHLRMYPRLAMNNEIPHGLLTVVIRKGTYTLPHRLEYIPNFYWHFRVQQQTLYTSGQSQPRCTFCKMVKLHTSHRDRCIQQFLHYCILGSQLHGLFLPRSWCKNDPRCYHYRVCKEEPSGVPRQRRRSQRCLRQGIQFFPSERCAFLSCWSCRSGQFVLGCTHAGAGQVDQDHRRLGGPLRVPRVDKKTDSEPLA
jgi:hypothetical protein